LSELPLNVLPDCTPEAISTVQRTLAIGAYDVCVFDFVHSAVLLPKDHTGSSVCFTHNVEAEIFKRHATNARNPAMRRIWRSQHGKMRRFEAVALRRFSSVLAVSDRDARHFRDHLGVSSVHVIPTGVDLDFFGWREPSPVSADSPPTVVFTGSMDWEANIDAVRHFLDDVWPLVISKLPEARFLVVGRRPPPWLVTAAKSSRVHVTGFVDDVRPYVHRAHVFVIPLRVGGGTRIKAFEAMAMGCPVVSTSIGIEGLDVIDGEHFVRRDSPTGQAQAIVELLSDASRRSSLSRDARRYVESRFGHRVAAAEFEKICLGVMNDVQGTT
jgi:glycosyltransferase involved in cell wall biosynthesis